MNIDLVVIYTNQLEECRAFYAGIGLHLEPEQHGRGPAHYAAVLTGGAVLELYPAGKRLPAPGPHRTGPRPPRPAARPAHPHRPRRPHRRPHHPGGEPTMTPE